MCCWFLRSDACITDFCLNLLSLRKISGFNRVRNRSLLLPSANFTLQLIPLSGSCQDQTVIFSSSLSPSCHSIQSPSPPQTQVTYWHPFASHIDFHDVILCVSYFRISSLCRSYSLYCPLFSFSATTGYVIDFVIVLMYPWFLKNNHIWPIIETSPSVADICIGMHMLRVSVRDMDTTDFRSTPSRTQFWQFTASI